MYATMNPVSGHPDPGFPDDFVPVDPLVYGPADPALPAGRTPGMRKSVTAWVSNGLAWVSLFTSAVLFFVAILEALGENDADGWVFAAMVLYVVGVVATVGAVVGLLVSFVRRLGADELHRAGPIVDLVLLSIVTLISVAGSASPLLFFL
ncbi:hypothetical protein [Gordonia alkanivorans]|uniref:hypothetical protein n=1 Tax=Gordonia alkanivorans TaxID=84096 RepID=UPI0024B70032|nr:hypothetical protein [Gordonia alkanivorans]MDJ0006165.1 hypothetical protein [Gordonia alkanivorans]MDJ0096140.1 hypothetical protein [Gordonia alkanivorans]MDJ0491792.1 hypothetical protein [Gordonia alkanivorans]